MRGFVSAILRNTFGYFIGKMTVAANLRKTSATKWQEKGYLDKAKMPKDPWGREYLYLSPGVHDDFDILSYGADGAQGGDGKNKDINSWELE